MVERGLLPVIVGDGAQRKARAQLRNPVPAARLFELLDALCKRTAGDAELFEHGGVGALGDLGGQAWDEGRGASHADGLAEERRSLGQVEKD